MLRRSHIVNEIFFPAQFGHSVRCYGISIPLEPRRIKVWPRGQCPLEIGLFWTFGTSLMLNEQKKCFFPMCFLLTEVKVYYVRSYGISSLGPPLHKIHPRGQSPLEIGLFWNFGTYLTLNDKKMLFTTAHFAHGDESLLQSWPKVDMP